MPRTPERVVRDLYPTTQIALEVPRLRPEDVLMPTEPKSDRQKAPLGWRMDRSQAVRHTGMMMGTFASLCG